jgi:hypothetical protein
MLSLHIVEKGLRGVVYDVAKHEKGRWNDHQSGKSCGAGHAGSCDGSLCR